MTLVERVAATEKVVAKFRNRPFSWRNRGTCIHLARAQMRTMGHRPPSIPDFRTAIGAKRALARTGHADLAALMDSMLPRIAPLAMLVGDLALVPGEPPFDALAIGAGGALFMYHGEADGLVPVKEAMTQVTAAWRL